MNNPANPDRLAEFRSKLKELVIEYDVEMKACVGYYGEPEGVEIFCGAKSAASCDGDLWNFGNGLRSMEQLKMGLDESV